MLKVLPQQFGFEGTGSTFRLLWFTLTVGIHLGEELLQNIEKLAEIRTPRTSFLLLKGH